MVKPAAPTDAEAGESSLLVSFDEGQAIFEQGEPGREMYIVHDGQVEVFKTFGGRERRTRVLESGDFFGEMSVLDDMPRSASARALTKCRLLPVDASTLDGILREYPEITIRMMRRLVRRLREHEEAGDRAAGIAARELGGVSRTEVEKRGPVLPRREEESAAPAAGAGDEQPSARLVHLAGGRSFPVQPGRENVIGRPDPVTGTTPEIDLGELDALRSLSRRHARIWFADGTFRIREELGVGNGTWLDGERLVTGREYPIAAGQTLKLGVVELRLEVEGGG